MSKVEAVASARDMETLLFAAVDQVKTHPTDANKQYLRELLESWKRQDWVINRVIDLLKELTPELELLEYTDIPASWATNTVWTVVAGRLEENKAFEIHQMNFQAYDATEYNTQSQQGFLIWLRKDTGKSDRPTYFYKHYNARPVYWNGLYFLCIEENLASPIYLPLGTEILLQVQNGSGVTISGGRFFIRGVARD